MQNWLKRLNVGDVNLIQFISFKDINKIILLLGPLSWMFLAASAMKMLKHRYHVGLGMDYSGLFEDSD